VGSYARQLGNAQREVTAGGEAEDGDAVERAWRPCSAQHLAAVVTLDRQGFVVENGE